ncbi:MAG: recombinase family protein, partial [Candidatus Pacebacteria bacterium]|nr:recombinase family protein [Candidatus Paceibacterota bacterium]
EKFNFSISLGLAKYYSDAISDNVKRAQEQMLRMGTYPSRPSYGYKREPISKDKTEIVVDVFASKVVQKAYEWYATSSFSMELLRQKIKSEFGVDWSKGMTDKILKDHFYYGLMTWKNKQYKHKYPPIITKELFDQVQQVKASFNKKPFKYAGKPYIYRGLLRCGHCGLAVTPEKHKGHVYYHCTQYNGKHGAEWLTEDDLTKQFSAVFDKLQMPQEAVDDIVEALQTNHKHKSDFYHDLLSRYQTEHQKYETGIEKAYDDYLLGSITKDKYEEKRKEYRAKQKEITKKIGKLNYADEEYYLTSEYLLKLASNAGKIFESSEVHEKRLLLKMTLENLELSGKKARYDWINPFDKIAFYASRQSWLPLQDALRTFDWREMREELISLSSPKFRVFG